MVQLPGLLNATWLNPAMPRHATRSRHPHARRSRRIRGSQPEHAGLPERGRSRHSRERLLARRAHVPKVATRQTIVVLGRKDLECTVCLNTYNDPRTLACGHTFCHRCLMQVFNVFDERGDTVLIGEVKCPCCRRELSQYLPNTNVFLAKVCSRLIRMCARDGCSALLPPWDMEEHLHTCPHARCRHCAESMSVADLPAHTQDACYGHRCRGHAGCGWQGTREELADHEASCSASHLWQYMRSNAARMVAV